jgi:hypothetical protein
MRPSNGAELCAPQIDRLVRGGYRCLGDVQAAGDAELLALRNFGIRSLTQVRGCGPMTSTAASGGLSDELLLFYGVSGRFYHLEASGMSGCFVNELYA